MCNCDENQQHRTYQHTHQFTEEEDTICILVFNVKSSGAFCPGIWNSEQKWPEEIEVKLPNFSEESAAKPEKARGSQATSPFNALSCENK